MTTLYFEAADDTDLHRKDFLKVAKHKNLRIYLGLHIGLDGFAIEYEVFEGNKYAGLTLLPTIQKFEARYNLNKPVIITDAGLLNKDNIYMLEPMDINIFFGPDLKMKLRESRTPRWRNSGWIVIRSLSGRLRDKG